MRELRWLIRCLRWGRPGIEVYRTISPHPAPPATVARLAARVRSGNWSAPDAASDPVQTGASGTGNEPDSGAASTSSGGETP